MWHQALLLRRDSASFIGIVTMPVVLMLFFKPSAQSLLRLEGFRSANGAEQTVPGSAVMFGLFMLGVVGTAFLREHGLRTWNRVRASSARPAEVIVGKLVPLLLVGLLQQVVLFSAGYVISGLRPSGSEIRATVLLLLVATGFALAVTSGGVLLASWAKTMPRLMMVATLAAVLLGGVGGALTPSQFLPTWVRGLGFATPSYWAMRGYTIAVFGGRSTTVMFAVAALGGFAVVCGSIAAVRFRFEEEKPGW